MAEGKLSPMMQQYREIKEKNKDYLLFYRLGDFYEMFFEDALIASRELELTLTGRDCGLPERAPMCGVPYHACDGYIRKLVSKGYKVAICEQMESPYLAKGIVKREVIRVVTPGTVSDSNMLNEGENNYIASVFLQKDGFGFCYADISTGEAYVMTKRGKDVARKLENELYKVSPAELFANEGFFEHLKEWKELQSRLGIEIGRYADGEYEESELQNILRNHFKENVPDLFSEEKRYALLAAGKLFYYLYGTQKEGVNRIRVLRDYGEETYLTLDYTAQRNLELLKTLRTGEKRGTLLWVLDKTKTAMGKRMLRRFLEQPLYHIPAITRRQAAVGELFENNILRGELQDALSGVYDLKRLLTKVIYRSITPREMLSLAYTAANLPKVKALSEKLSSALLQKLNGELDPLTDLREMIESAVDEDAPPTMKDGGVIKKGYHKELDELREIKENATGFLSQILEREREATGIKNMKIGYNKVFGYYIEVSKSNLSMVPDTYIRKQTLVNGERYITEELKELESKVLYASEKIVALEAELYDALRENVAKRFSAIEKTAAAVAELDVYCSLAQVAVENHYVCPSLNVNGIIDIKDGRHPVVEAVGTDGPFIPNDAYLDNKTDRLAIITGPNMAGKSTYMRQVALIMILAQMGSFIPAREANLCPVDQIFTRVGASDDLTAGQSTFMVEMSEVAHILKSATRESFIILDEIGRGTSTFDGMSIAKAVVEYILKGKSLGAKTLFATHYHELTRLEEECPGVVNYNIAVRKKGDDILFLRKIVRGGADDSYGVEVAKLAGVPDKVIKRAKEVLKELETKGLKQPKPAAIPAQTQQTSFLSDGLYKVENRLRTLDVDDLSPKEALSLLYELKALLP